MHSCTYAYASLPASVPPPIWETNHGTENVQLHANASLCLGLVLLMAFDTERGRRRSWGFNCDLKGSSRGFNGP